MSMISDLTENLKSSAAQLFDRVQESPFFQRIKEQYDSLPPIGQKSVLGIISLVFVAFLLSFPLSSYWSATEYVVSFEEKRNLIQDLFRVNSEGQISLPAEPAPSIENLRMQIENKLRQSQLTTEQMRGVQTDSIPAGIAQESIDGAISVSLFKLNLRQVVDIGYSIQSISTGIKMVDLVMQANSGDKRYFDVVYKLITLKVPDLNTHVDAEPLDNLKKGKTPPRPTKNDEDL